MQPEANAVDEDSDLSESRFDVECVDTKQEENFAHPAPFITHLIAASRKFDYRPPFTFVLNEIINLDERERTTFS